MLKMLLPAPAWQGNTHRRHRSRAGRRRSRHRCRRSHHRRSRRHRGRHRSHRGHRRPRRAGPRSRGCCGPACVLMRGGGQGGHRQRRVMDRTVADTCRIPKGDCAFADHCCWKGGTTGSRANPRPSDCDKGQNAHSGRPSSPHLELSLVQVGDGLIRSVGHGHKGEAARPAALTVLGDESILQAQPDNRVRHRLLR